MPRAIKPGTSETDAQARRPLASRRAFSRSAASPLRQAAAHLESRNAHPETRINKIGRCDPFVRGSHPACLAVIRRTGSRGGRSRSPHRSDRRSTSWQPSSPASWRRASACSSSCTRSSLRRASRPFSLPCPSAPSDGRPCWVATSASQRPRRGRSLSSWAAPAKDPTWLRCQVFFGSATCSVHPASLIEAELCVLRQADFSVSSRRLSALCILVKSKCGPDNGGVSRPTCRRM